MEQESLTNQNLNTYDNRLTEDASYSCIPFKKSIEVQESVIVQISNTVDDGLKKMHRALVYHHIKVLKCK